MFAANWTSRRRLARSLAVRSATLGSNSIRPIAFDYGMIAEPAPIAIDNDLTVGNPTYNFPPNASGITPSINNTGNWVTNASNGHVSGATGYTEYQTVIYTPGHRRASIKFSVDDAIHSIVVNGRNVLVPVTGNWTSITSLNIGTLPRGKNRISVTVRNGTGRTGIIFTVVDDEGSEVVYASDASTLRCGSTTQTP